MVKTHTHTTFPLVYRLIELTLILAIVTTTIESVFSTMQIVKSDLRNWMGDEQLNDSIMIYMEKALFASVEYEFVLQCNQHMQTQRIQLSSINTLSKDNTST